MSDLHTPPAIPERHEAGRHGTRHSRGGRRPAGGHTSHLLIALVPAALVGCLGAGAVTAVILAGSRSRSAQLSLVAAAAGALIVLCLAALAADRAGRRGPQLPNHQGAPGQQQAAVAGELRRRLGEPAFLVSRGRQEMRALAEQVAAGEAPPPRVLDPRPSTTADPVGYLMQELQKAQNEAWNAVIEAGRPEHGPVQRVDVFVNLARRMQTLSHRAIQGLDELENQVEDPDLMKGLFRVDHLVTRLRRQAESLAVVGGAASRRKWSRPVTLYEVLRSAIAEVESFSRVKVVPPVEGHLDGGAVADVIHLLAELIENATRFAPPSTQVLLRTETVTAGLAIEIEDRGLGIPRETQHRLNDLLADADRGDSDELVREGRIGLFVVSALARRHRIAARLQTNIYGGTQAVVVIPNELIGPNAAEPRTAESPTGAAPPASTPVPPGAPPPAAPAPLPTSEPAPVPPGGAPPAAAAPRAAPEPAPGAGRPPMPGDPGGPGAFGGVSGEHAAPVGRDERPPLPRRGGQANLVPELRDPPPPRQDDEADVGHNPGMMAAFREGMRNAQDEG